MNSRALLVKRNLKSALLSLNTGFDWTVSLGDWNKLS